MKDVVDSLWVRNPQAILLRAYANNFSQGSEYKTPVRSDERGNVPQMDRSNERYSRSSRGTSSLLLRPLRSGCTIGALDGSQVQCYRLPEGGGRVVSIHWEHTKNPRRVDRPWDILDRGELPTPLEKNIGGGRTNRERCELILHG